MINESNRIEGRVAAILNAKELVINVGERHRVLKGMKFAVLAEKPLEIRDPDSNRVIGVVDREKVRVEAADVQLEMTICRTYRVKEVPGIKSNWAEQLAGGFFPSRKVEETLAASLESMPPPLSEEESYVKVKDRVIQVPEE